MSTTAQKLTIEAVGTGLLCFTVAVSVGQVAGGHQFAAIAIGSTLMTAIYAGGHISGANYNPAVSLALFIRGMLSMTDMLQYMAAQVVGAAAAGLLASAIVPEIGYPSPTDVASSLIAEIVLTFALCHTVLHTATATAAKNTSYYGLAIGFTVISGAISVGGVSGGAFNPAVGVLTFLSGSATKEALIVYSLGPFAGAALAGVTFKYVTHPKECGTLMNPAWNIYVIEFIGTFLLCYTVATAASPSNGSNLATVSIGSMLMAQVYAGAATSGANYNPAVTFALFLHSKLKGTKDMDIAKAAIYMATQCAAGVASVYVAGATAGSTGAPVDATTTGPVLGVLPAAMVVEVIGTFFLVFVVLQVAASKNGGQDFFGLAIGFTVTSMAITLGGLSGGAFNPAVGCLSFVLYPDALVTNLVNYVVGPMTGAILATLLFRATNGGEYGARGYLEMS